MRHGAHSQAPMPERPPIGWQAPLLDLTSAVLRRWQLFLIVMSIGIAVGSGSYLVTRPFYQSICVAVLLPREKPPLDVEITNGTIEATRDIANRGDTGAGLLPSRVDLYTSIMRSDSVLTEIGIRFGTRLRLPENLSPSELVLRMRGLVKISGTDEGMFHVQVTAHDPSLAADVANALVDEVADASKLIEGNLLAQQLRTLKASLTAARESLTANERSLADYVSGHGIVDIEKQTGDALSMIREAETSRRELVRQRIERLTSFTESDHVARNLAEQIKALDKTIEELQRRAHGGIAVGGTNIQEIKLRMKALQSQVDRSRDLVGALESQCSIWEVRAGQPSGAVAVIKPAIPLRERAGPSKRDTIGAALLVAFVLGLVVVMIREQWEKVAHEPYLRRRAEEIRMHAQLLVPPLRTRRARETSPPETVRSPDGSP